MFQDLINLVESDPDLLNRILQATNHVLPIWLRNKVTIIAVEGFKFTISKIRATSRLNEDNTMLMVFLNYIGIIHNKFAPRGQTFDQKYYKNLLQRMSEKYGRKDMHSGKTKIEASTPTTQGLVQPSVSWNFFYHISNTYAFSTTLFPWYISCRLLSFYRIENFA